MKNKPKGCILVVLLLGKKRLKELFHAVGLTKVRPDLDVLVNDDIFNNIKYKAQVSVPLDTSIFMN